MPRNNLNHLVLKDEAIQAVEANRYHIYGASIIDEGLSVLTGIPAGEPQKDGTYPEDTINYRGDQRLREMAQQAKEFGTSAGRDDDG